MKNLTPSSNLVMSSRSLTSSHIFNPSMNIYSLDLSLVRPPAFGLEGDWVIGLGQRVGVCSLGVAKGGGEVDMVFNFV